MNLTSREEILKNQRELALKRRQQVNAQSVVMTATRTPSIRQFSAPKTDRTPRENDYARNDTSSNLNPRQAQGITTDRNASAFLDNERVVNGGASSSREDRVINRKSPVISNTTSRNFKTLGSIVEHPEHFDSLDSTQKNEKTSGIQEAINLAQSQGKDSTDSNGRQRHRLRRSRSNICLLLEDEEEELLKKTKDGLNEEQETPESKCLQLERSIAQEGVKAIVKDISSSSQGNMLSFLMRPCPKKAEVVKCYVKRNRSGTNALFPEYR